MSTPARAYEALVILRATGTEQDVARQASQIEEQVKKLGGHVETSQNLGRRRLAFRISRQAEGYYHLLRFLAPTQQVSELERLLHLNDGIVRFMILTAEEVDGPSVASHASSEGSRVAVSTGSSGGSGPTRS